LLAAPGGTVNFSGGLRRNGTDTTAGVTVGDGAHNGVVQLTGVNTYVGGTTVAGGTLTVNSSLAAGSAVTVASGATLAGTGTINGPVTVQNGGTLSAGDSSIGTLTINNNLTLAGNVWIKINKSASPSNDLVIVSGQLTNAGCGVLTISNSGPALAAGDTFKLFSRALPNAGALTIFPPAPAPGLAWANNLALNGSLGVVAVATNPTNLAATVGNGTLTLSWPGDHMGWTLQTQTNPWTAGIGTNWVPVADSGSTNRIVFPVDPAKGSVFYRLTYP
jgi:autotransporter-associated beta strand protein